MLTSARITSVTQATRQNAKVLRPPASTLAVQPVPDEAAPQHAEGVAGLTDAELVAMINVRPAMDPSAPDALAPYLATSPGLSADAYSEWIARVCEQPADD
jgi:hypothetical protein